MARGLTSAVKTELATGIIEPVILVEIGFSTPIYLTNASFDLTSSVSGTSRTYLSNGHLRGITGVQETNAPTKNSLSVSLSGVDQTYIALALTENIINDDVFIYRGYLNSSWGNFSKTSGRTTTNNSQQRFFSDDVGMVFSALTVRDIKWGRE